jgi:hypothetical protein
MITAGATHQHLAEGFPVGMRLHSAPVLRLADANRSSSDTWPEPTVPGVSTPSPMLG